MLFAGYLEAVSRHYDVFKVRALNLVKTRNGKQSVFSGYEVVTTAKTALYAYSVVSKSIQRPYS